MTQFWKAALVAAGGLFCAVAPASATLMLSADINGTIFSCADQAACDLNSTIGQLVTGPQTIGGVNFLGSAQTQTIGTNNTLDTTSFQITNNGGSAATIKLAVSGTSFQGPVTTLSESGSGTWQNAIGSTIDMTFFADAANTQGATTPTDLPGVLQADSGVLSALLRADSFNFSDTSPFVDPDLYSMSLGTVGTLAAGGQLTGRSQAIIAEPVPEPGSLALLGSGLFAFGGILRWRQRRYGSFA